MTKHPRLKIAALLLIWTLAVYLAGPIVTALARAATFRAAVTRMDDQARAHARYVTAERLLDLYDARNPPPPVMYQVELDYCGYEPLPDDETSKGLDYLWVAGLLTDNKFQRRLRIERFTATLGDFGFVFLGNCISGTVLAHRCELYVRQVLERNGIRYARDMPTTSPDKHEARIRHAVTCRYLDGVAARARRPLARPQN